MHKYVPAAMAAFVVLMSAPALTAAQQPHDVQALFASWQDGKPKEFSLTADTRSADAHVTMRIDGQSEGTTPENTKLKAYAQLDIERRGETAHLELQFVVHQARAYVLLETMQGSTFQDESLQALAGLQGQWYQLPLSLEWYTLLSADSAQWQAITRHLTAEKHRFATGAAYHLASDASAVAALSEWLDGVSFGLLPALPAHAWANLEGKVDVNEDGDFRFGRFAAQLRYDETDASLDISGTVQRQFSPVYVFIPPVSTVAPTLQQYVPIHLLFLAEPRVASDEADAPEPAMEPDMEFEDDAWFSHELRPNIRSIRSLADRYTPRRTMIKPSHREQVRQAQQRVRSSLSRIRREADVISPHDRFRQLRPVTQTVRSSERPRADVRPSRRTVQRNAHIQLQERQSALRYVRTVQQRNAAAESQREMDPSGTENN